MDWKRLRADLAYYWAQIAAIPAALWIGINKVLTVIGILAFLLLLANRPLAQALADWEGVDPLWALVPAALLAVYGIMRGNRVGLDRLVTERDQWHDKYQSQFEENANRTGKSFADSLLKGQLEAAGGLMKKLTEDNVLIVALEADEWSVTTDRFVGTVCTTEEAAEYRQGLPALSGKPDLREVGFFIAQRQQRLRGIYARERKPMFPERPKKSKAT